MGQDSLSPLTVTGKQESRSSSEIDIQEIQAERVSELLGYVPGLGIAASDSAGFGDTLSIRGSANTLFFGGAGVALVVDDVPFGDVFTRKQICRLPHLAEEGAPKIQITGVGLSSLVAN